MTRHSSDGTKKSESLRSKPPSLTPNDCRDTFRARRQGGNGELSEKSVRNACSNPLVFHVCDDLVAFTGLTEDEVMVRLRRLGRFHFEGEHDFWNPTSSTELAWYYATSVDYLFANALHGVWKGRIDQVAHKEFEPVLDYSGGVGNNVIYLATKGIRSQYFGIGMVEFAFAEFRVQKHGLAHLVEFKRPFSLPDWTFDPVGSPLLRDGSLGAVIAMDVFEHIPQYHLVVEAMVASLKIGGVIMEETPFDNDVAQLKGKSDTRVHLSDGGINMTQAMGPTMQKVAGRGKWKKVSL